VTDNFSALLPGRFLPPHLYIFSALAAASLETKYPQSCRLSNL
jgi:hypothetical protein